jgi:hypothetical protein
MDDLRVTLTRQAQTGTGNGGRGADSALPYDWNASHVRADVGNTLSTWIRELDFGDTRDLAGNIRAWCHWLADRVERIRGHAAAEQILDEITYQVSDVRRAIDAHAETIYCGTCDICGKDLYAPREAAEAVCRWCVWAGLDARYPVESRRAGMLEQAKAKHLPRGDILRAIPSLYRLQVNAATFRTWIHRGQLRPVETTADGVPLYRVGDVVALAEQTALEGHAAPTVAKAPDLVQHSRAVGTVVPGA